MFASQEEAAAEANRRWPGAGIELVRAEIKRVNHDVERVEVHTLCRLRVPAGKPGTADGKVVQMYEIFIGLDPQACFDQAEAADRRRDGIKS